MSTKEINFPDILIKDDIPTAGKKVLKFHLEKMIKNETGTKLCRDPKPLHDMRVAIRRLRVGMKFFGDYIDPETSIKIKKGLQRSGRYLGRVRDLDVIIEMLDLDCESTIKNFSPEWTSFIQELRTVWVDDRSRARKKMLKHLGGNKYLNLKNLITSLVRNSSDSWSGEYSNEQLNHFMIEGISESLQNVSSCEIHPHCPSSKRLHELRIAIKELRYLIEFFGDIVSKNVKNYLSQLKSTQTILGDINDLDIFINRLVSVNIGNRREKYGSISELPLSTNLYNTQYIKIKREILNKKINGFLNVWVYFSMVNQLIIG